MANIKISELTALTPPDAADLVPVTDASASQTKRTTVGEIVGIISGDVDVADNGTATISELPVSKLQDGDARQLLQTDAAGTGVEWTSNVDVPGTLDVTGATTLDATLGVTGQSTLASAAVSDLTSGRVVLAGTSGELEDNAKLTFNGTQLDVDGNVVITGDLTVEGASTILETETVKVEDKNIELGVVTSPTDVTADGGGITLKGTTDKTINWVDATDAWTSSERFSVPLGSDGAPSLTFTGDEDTGVFSPGANQLALSTNGTGRLFVDENGKIGAGTSSISAKLHVSNGNSSVTPNANADEIFVENNGNAGITLGSPNTGNCRISFGDPEDAQAGLIFYDHNTNHLRFDTAATERLRITSAGLVGIGSSSVTHALTVTTSGTDAVKINTADYGYLDLSNGTSTVRLQNVASVPRIGTATNHPLAFAVNEVEKMRLTATGLAIGTTSPSSILHCSSLDAVLTLQGTRGTGASATIQTGGANSQNLVITAGTDLYQRGAIHLFQNVAGTTEYGRWDSSGRLLVGTSSDSGNTTLVLQGNSAGATGTPTIAFKRNIGVAANNEIAAISFGNVIGGEGANLKAVGDGTWSNGTSHPTRLVFSTTADGASSPTEQLRITSDRYVRLASGTGGIQFNGDTAAANALDDYEEGTWTPAITGSTTAGTISYDNRAGKYTKVGRQVTVSCACDTGVVTAAPTGNIRISGLPFACVSDAEFSGAAELKGIPFPASTTSVVARGVNGQTYVEFFAYGSNAATGRVQADSLATDDYINFTLTFFV